MAIPPRMEEAERSPEPLRSSQALKLSSSSQETSMAQDVSDSGGAAVGTPGAGQTQRSVMVSIGALLLGMLLAALDQTIVSTALPTIVSDLGGMQHLSWVVTAYMLASTAATPLWGKLGDLYGRKKLFQTAI